MRADSSLALVLLELLPCARSHKGRKYWCGFPREWNLEWFTACSRTGSGEAGRAKQDTGDAMNEGLRPSVETDLAGAGSLRCLQGKGKVDL